MKDELTGLDNSKYLEEEYLNYLKNYRDSNYVMIDFADFKKINDTYGHEVGDKCLKLFANKLKIFFINSLVIRLHGDEFCIVTYNDEKTIDELLRVIDLSINIEVESEIIPLKFEINAGSTKALFDLNKTKEQVDYMMYHAKKNNMIFQPFEYNIYQHKLEENQIFEDLKEKLKSGSFSYYGRNIYNYNDEETNYLQIYTKDENGKNILSGNSYRILRKNYQISRFDIFNLQNLIGRISMINNNQQYFINIDYKSLLSFKELKKFLEYIEKSTVNGISNIILSIDLSQIETREYELTINMIKKLSDFGFKIRLDKIDSSIADFISEDVNPDFIKISANMWKKYINDKERLEYFKSKIKTYSLIGNNVSLIFDKIESDEEKEFLHNIVYNNNALYSGNNYSKEKKLILN